jgi:hypothetical protein
MSIRSLAKNLPADPDNKDSVLGWAVVRSAPWSFVDIYANRDVAQIEAERLGAGHSVEYGSHKLGTDDFIGGSTPPK